MSTQTIPKPIVECGIERVTTYELRSVLWGAIKWWQRTNMDVFSRDIIITSANEIRHVYVNGDKYVKEGSSQ